MRDSADVLAAVVATAGVAEATMAVGSSDRKANFSLRSLRRGTARSWPGGWVGSEGLRPELPPRKTESEKKGRAEATNRKRLDPKRTVSGRASRAKAEDAARQDWETKKSERPECPS